MPRRKIPRNVDSYLHLRLQRTRIYSLFRLRSDNVVRHTATAPAASPCWALLSVREWLVHSLSPSFDRQHHPAMLLCTGDRPTAKRLTMCYDLRSNHRPDSKWCTTMLNRMMQRLRWAIKENETLILFSSIHLDADAHLHQCQWVSVVNINWPIRREVPILGQLILIVSCIESIHRHRMWADRIVWPINSFDSYSYWVGKFVSVRRHLCTLSYLRTATHWVIIRLKEK